ncbi:hypothetical protein IWX90DRAFT_490734 [Phyllosticta citrichinensis]|uniref:Chromo domain-containing protein n=1 Tax=Phyllosticta citrichinensis TaxID=1130410 RepID=A0ABR1XFG7_9PEZI
MASRAWPAVRILAEHQDKYQIQWEGDWLPTWEPKSNASERLVADWVQQQRADGRDGGGPGCYYAAKCIVRERPKHYLVDWCPDECTGEQYAPTWVHKKAATRALVAEWNNQTKKKKKQKKTTTTMRKGLAAQTTGKRSRHHDDDALPANQEPPPQPLPLSRPQSSPPSAHLGLAQQQQQQQQQLQLDAAESENGSSRRNPAPPATPLAMAKLRKLREQRRQAPQQMPPASAVETMTEKQGEAGRGAWWDGMPDLSRKSVYGLRKTLFH